MVTIKEVAKKSGVSPSTVSRVIADNPRIGEQTKKKVRKIMKELGYHPNVHARNLVAKSTKAIGVIMPSSANKALQNPFFPEVLRGISSEIHKEKYSMILSTGETEKEIFDEVKRLVYGRYVDGVILLYSRMNDPITTFLNEENFPFVLVGKPHEHMDSITHVDNDNYLAGKELTNVLIEQQHKKIAFIGGADDLFVTMDRQAGYVAALKEAGLEVIPEYKVHTEFLESGGKSAVEKLISLKDKPTGIIVSDDLIGLGVLGMLGEHGFRVPQDVSLASFNNVYFSEITSPPLTTVDINIFELGIQSARALIEKTINKDEPAKRIIISHSIKHRSSVEKLNELSLNKNSNR